MADTGENFAAFNSRALVEMVGGVTDEALKGDKNQAISKRSCW